MSVGDCHRRSIAKAVSWRATGTLDTFILSWVITGNLAFAGSIAGVETMTKMVLYYGHERLWAMVAWGRGQPAAPSERTGRSPLSPVAPGPASRRSPAPGPGSVTRLPARRRSAR